MRFVRDWEFAKAELIYQFQRKNPPIIQRGNSRNRTVFLRLNRVIELRH
jgi:hypothetical protein